MRIGIDIDDTITNSYDLISREVASVYNYDYLIFIKNGIGYSDFYTNKELFPDFPKGIDIGFLQF